MVGFLMGGQIAQFIGSDHPQRMISLTLISTSTNDEDHAWALQAAIPGASLHLIGGMGHTIHSQFYEELIALIYGHVLGD